MAERKTEPGTVAEGNATGSDCPKIEGEPDMSGEAGRSEAAVTGKTKNEIDKDASGLRTVEGEAEAIPDAGEPVLKTDRKEITLEKDVEDAKEGGPGSKGTESEEVADGESPEEREKEGGGTDRSDDKGKPFGKELDERGSSEIVDLVIEKDSDSERITGEEPCLREKDEEVGRQDADVAVVEGEDRRNEVLHVVNEEEKSESQGKASDSSLDSEKTGAGGDRDEATIVKPQPKSEAKDPVENGVTKDDAMDERQEDNANKTCASTGEHRLAGSESPNSNNNETVRETENSYQPEPEVGIVGPPTAVSELINEEELRNESVLSAERGGNVQHHVAEWVQNSVKVEAGENEGVREDIVKDGSKKTKKRGDAASAAPARNSQRVVSNIIKRSIKCLNKMHAMDPGTGNGRSDKREGASPIVPQNQQNGAALPEEAAVAGQAQVKQEPVSESEIDPDIVSEIQKAKNAKESRKRRSPDDAQNAKGNTKRACLEQREEFLAALVGGEKISTEELTLRADQLRAELLALDQLARAKEKEWNEILSMRKLKEEAYLRIERRRQVVVFMEGNGPLGEANLSLEWDSAKENKSYTPQQDKTLLKDKRSRPQQISSKQSENGQKDSDAQSLENRQIGEGRQGPIVDVRSIIADYRLRHPETVPRRGRRMRNSVNVGSVAGGTLFETGHAGDSRPSSTDSCKSNPNTGQDPNSMSFKDVLVQFAKLSQQQGEPVKTPQNYPDVTLHPVAPSPSPQIAAPQQTGSLLHGILTKSQSPRPTTFSPTLARLLTAPERERNSPVATSTPQQNTAVATQHLLSSGYQGSNPVSISDLLSSSKARTEITITPVVSTAVPSHSNSLIHVEDVEEETTVNEERGGRGSSNTRDDRDSPPRCQGCHERAAQFVCAGCGNQWYCSRECQVSAWDEHSEVCSG